jgi:hypothetical protein
MFHQVVAVVLLFQWTIFAKDHHKHYANHHFYHRNYEAFHASKYNNTDTILTTTNTNNNNNIGVVFCAGGKEFMKSGAYNMIWQIRFLWRAELGIAVMHCSELSEATKTRMKLLYPALHIIDVCGSANNFGMDQRTSKWRLRGFFCKVAAILASPFEETALIDLDVTWFKSPTVVFDSPAYKKTGALFFRDRVNFAKAPPNGGIIPGEAIALFRQHGVEINEESAATRFLSDGINLWWKHGALTDGHPLNGEGSIGDIQESSLVVINKSKIPKTIQVLQELLPTFDVGYGDKV